MARRCSARGLALALALLSGVGGPALAAPGGEPVPSLCGGMFRAGVIPPGASAVVVGHPEAAVPSFLCLRPGAALSRLRVCGVLPPAHEDEPDAVVVLRRSRCGR